MIMAIHQQNISNRLKFQSPNAQTRHNYAKTTLRKNTLKTEHNDTMYREFIKSDRKYDPQVVSPDLKNYSSNVFINSSVRRVNSPLPLHLTATRSPETRTAYSPRVRFTYQSPEHSNIKVATKHPQK